MRALDCAEALLPRRESEHESTRLRGGFAPSPLAGEGGGEGFSERKPMQKT